MKIKTLLIGSGDFAIPIFQTALNSDFLEIIGIVTQPDKPFGRKQEISGSPVFEALKGVSGIKWFKPLKFRQEYNEILDVTSPELVLVASYGQILPKDFIDYPKFKALNFHGSILPELRGAVPVPMAILNGLKETGVTLQVMSEGMDEGDIVSIRTVEISDDETTESLMGKLAEIGSNILNVDLPKYIAGDLLPYPQDHSKATYCYKTDIEKERAEIIFNIDIKLAERMIRAFYPWPVAFINLNGKMLKIFKAQIYNSISNKDFLITREGKHLLLHLKNGTLELIELQIEGKKRDSSSNYLFLASNT